MSPAGGKRKSSSAPPWPARLISFLRGPGRPLVWMGLLGAVFAGAWCVVWLKVRGPVLSSSDYLVGPQQVRITPLPEWIHSDICAEVFQNTSLEEQLSLMDEELTERIANAFSLHPWVAKVRRVSKHHPARVEVELLYRRPVCMVQVSGKLFPVDAQGVLLPGGDFSPVEAGRYPRLVGIQAVPVGILGEGWGDRRVVGGAEIAEALLPAWDELKLARIELSRPPAGGVSKRHTYWLVTRGGTRIFWGPPPGSSKQGDLSVADKLARLRNYVATHGTLEGRGGPQRLDVHNLPQPRVASRPKA